MTNCTNSRLQITDFLSLIVSNMEGVLLANKPKGPTSFQIVKLLRRVTGEKKIGHSGTLDPNARGLLILALGKATKSIKYLQELGKGYIAKILLGKLTDTDDISGKIISSKDIKPVSFEKLDGVLDRFIGKIKQVPPRFSAVKVQGRRAYKLAREGKGFVLQEKQIEIGSLRILYYRHPFLKIKIECSKGTYIRALARDIGYTLSSYGTLFELTRYRVGKWTLVDSLTFEELKDRKLIESRILTVSQVLGKSSFREESDLCTRKVYEVL